MNTRETPGPGPRVTMIDIARHAGVSKSTVSLVLQASPLVKAETREKVVASIEQLGYVYNRGAANLRSARSNIVGMVINDLANPFFAELAVGMEHVFHTAGYIPFIANTTENPKRQAEVLRSMSEHDIAGLIICPARGTKPADIESLAGLSVPIVLAMRRLAGRKFSSVTPDNLRGARRATEHLIALGHKRIAFFGGYSDMIAQNDRCGGFQAALIAAGLPIEPDLIIEGPPNRECGLNAVGRVLDRAEPATAALCFNDVVAFGALSGLERRGLTAGRDFALVGFDDVSEARHTNPPLTTVHVDTAALGERAAHQVLRMIHGDTRPEEFVSDVDLVVRASCGAEGGRRQ
ncbi:LacI family DNA-binding transcriptional regulator [Kaistia dalseonensis]|uniref:LacI family transcriptional regulator n=1 Tax=Kaistia dalseonensis TaxID=410840 RepID=A0ABU0HDF3_9HYPH|nr:LacI family DNA-binding transcriptional regulator [Kaistia dalseonensis]MCX5497701.1 LacI family DNA-binding transcriptional regulator [Kaistia dalseonensis]MDQ0440345.1 LacI family transcriptional regulator [Kaistia dalseonensis]